MSLGLTWLGEALQSLDQEAYLCVPACCGAVTAGAFPTTSYGMPTVATTFAASPAVASGLAAIRDVNGEADQVICWAGDGGTYDISLATLSAAAERNENLLYICYDNEIYGNTGGQRSSATPPGARTSTTPHGKSEAKKDVMSILTAHGIPYAATLSVAHPDDFKRKLRTALTTTGMRFLLMHSPCPTGWKSEPSESVELVRLAVRSGLFPLYEAFHGKRWRLNATPDWTDPTEYYRRQRRFRPEEVDLEVARAWARDQFRKLEVLAEAFPAPDS
jgi:pyruvate ferredoxin oxidoreductase beta subunit/2-oxoisovalerate ferredoxin oxidoreductase beta subunit